MTVDRTQLDALYSETLDMAVHLLKKAGEFFPVGMVLKADGQSAHVAFHDGNEHRPSQQVIDELKAVFKAQAKDGAILASALASDVRVRSAEGGNPVDAIMVMLRAADFCRDVIVPYTIESSGLFKKKRQVALGDARAQAADQDIFV